MKNRLAILTLLAIVATGTPARAGGTLSTRMLWPNNNQTVVCLVTNVGTTPAEVRVQGRGFPGTVLAAEATSCLTDPSTLDPGESCHVAFSKGSPAWCAFTGKGKLRAVGEIRDASGEVQVVPATTK